MPVGECNTISLKVNEYIVKANVRLVAELRGVWVLCCCVCFGQVWGDPSLRWPLQDIRVLRGCCTQINPSFIPPAYLHCPPRCNTIARLLDSIQLPFRATVCILYTIQ